MSRAAAGGGAVAEAVRASADEGRAVGGANAVSAAKRTGSKATRERTQ